MDDTRLDLDPQRRAVLQGLLRQHALNPDGFLENYVLGMAYYNLRNDFDYENCQEIARPYLESALPVSTDAGTTREILTALGGIGLHTENYKEAIHYLRRLVALTPDDDQTAYRLNLSLYRMGRHEEAQRVIEGLVARSEAALGSQTQVGHGQRVGLIAYSDIIQGRVGETAIHCDLLIKAKMLGYLKVDKLALALHPGQVANRALLECFRPYINISRTDEESQALRIRYGGCPVYPYVNIPGFGVCEMHTTYPIIQREWHRRKRRPLLRPPGAIVKEGWRTMGRLGVPEGAWLVSLHVREPGFFRQHKEHSTDTYRNADIKTYTKAIEAVAAHGGWVIRMGDASMTPLPPMDNVVDYALSDTKSDWMDVFLWSRSRFHIGTISGAGMVPVAFGVPVVATNTFPVTSTAIP